MASLRTVVTKWEQLTWPDLAAAVTEATVVLVPVGATEQHGPHLPLCTDTVIAETLCEAAAERTAALVAPAISVGCSFGHGRRLPGTISLTPEQLATVARQYAEWFAQSGVRKVLFVNAHAGNAAALAVATDNLRFERADLQVGAVSWWDLDPQLAAEMTADGVDVHANRAETAVMLAIAPELVARERIEHRRRSRPYGRPGVPLHRRQPVTQRRDRSPERGHRRARQAAVRDRQRSPGGHGGAGVGRSAADHVIVSHRPPCRRRTCSRATRE